MNVSRWLQDNLYIPPKPVRSRVVIFLLILAPLLLVIMAVLGFLTLVLGPYPPAALSLGALCIMARYLMATYKNKDADKEAEIKRRSMAWWRGEGPWYDCFK